MKHSKLVIAAYVINILMQSEAISDTLYVPLEYPFIQDAINVASEGDVIEVSAGQYSYCEVNETHPCSLTIQARESNGMIDDVYISAPKCQE